MDYEDDEDNWTVDRYGNRSRRAARNDAAVTWKQLYKDPFPGSYFRNGPDDDGAPVHGDRRQDPSYDRHLQREWWAQWDQRVPLTQHTQENWFPQNYRRPANEWRLQDNQRPVQHLNQPSGPTAPRYGRFQRYHRAGR